MADNPYGSKTPQEIIREELDTPEGRLRLRALREEAVHNMLVQRIWSPKLSFTVTRKEHVVTFQWEFQKLFVDPSKFCLGAWLNVMDYEPDPENLERIPFDYPRRGNGRVDVALVPGECYHANFVFLEDGKKEIDPIAIHFVIAIPLPKQFKAAVDKAIAMEKSPALRLKDDLENFMEADNSFDETCREIIGRIKAKGLSPEEEAEKIEEFQDYARQAKLKHGV